MFPETLLLIVVFVSPITQMTFLWTKKVQFPSVQVISWSDNYDFKIWKIVKRKVFEVLWQPLQQVMAM